MTFSNLRPTIALAALAVITTAFAAMAQRSTLVADNKAECQAKCAANGPKHCLMAYFYFKERSTQKCEMTIHTEPDVMRKGSYAVYSSKLSKWITPSDITVNWPHLKIKLDELTSRRMAKALEKATKNQTAYCRRHAMSSSHQQKTNTTEKCGLSGWGWTQVIKVHYDWCMSLPKEVYARKTMAVYRDRYNALYQCTSRQN